MKFLLSLAIICFLHTFSFAGEEIVKVKDPIEVKDLAKSEIEGLQWNRWTSKNFVVLALDDSYAVYLNKHLELAKTWTLARWGLLDVDYSVQCKVICVDDPVVFNKLFRLNATKVEIRRDSQGKITETVIFLLANQQPSYSIPSPLTEVSLAEFGQKYNTNFGWWTYRGMCGLNGSLNQIKTTINLKKQIESNDPLYFSKGLFAMTKDDYLKLSDAQKKLYDASAIAFCLLIRKEFGQEKFHNMMKLGNETNLAKITGFNSYDEFDRVFKRYVIDLSNDINSQKTPDTYLQIYEPKN